MFEDLKTIKENINNINIKLNEGDHIDLGWLHASVTGSDYPMPDQYNTPKAHELTLSYLKPLLEQKKLKVGGLDIFHLNSKGESDFREFIGSASEIIDNIRAEWNEADERAKQTENPAELSAFESFGITFILPENKWPYEVDYKK
jgi:hypothetical protein